ncbi:MAG: hypothetical protein OXL96_04355 [Candidatus Poribacteria bacterium]|nr:hypothetical protein [Candidatus Poribacteria bacterium]
MPSDYKAITEYNEDQLGKDTSSRKTQVSIYSDPTHFVYEILQNADDYGATKVLFKLSEDDIVIEHNGEPFKKKHVEAITYFGESTSREDLVKTGRFGIGFKSVFAFTATPIIISEDEHFQIYGLYRVKEYPYPEGFSRAKTRIILPFNHESKQPDFVEELVSKEEAYSQISECLTDLDINTLLFTLNIREIRWEVGDQSECYIREDEEEDPNTRLTAIKDGKRENRYLVFSKIPTWEDEKHKPVEIAFALDKLHKQYQLSPIDGEFLHVLFPTTEKTGLRFILNGPYRTNPARETISKKDDFNLHLMKVTCELMREALPKLRNKKHLTVQFLSILPNKENVLNEKDKLWDFYNLLRDTIVNEFRDKKLTPTKKGGHAAASGLYRDRDYGELSGLIQDKDLAVLLEKKNSQPLWVANLPPRKRNEKGQFIQDENERISDFLTTLNISEWAIYDFIKILRDQPSMAAKLFKEKPIAWHQKLYAFFGDSSYSCSDLRIVRCSDSKYRIGKECHFPIDDVESKPQKGETQDGNFRYVVKGIYSSGENKNEQEKAREFLEKIGVCEVNETERIKAILRQRYEDPDTVIPPKLHEKDMKKFIVFVENNPDKAALFEGYNIFDTSGGNWSTSLIFLDSPYLETGLNVYYEDDEYWEYIEKENVYPYFSLDYEESDIDPEKLGKFAKALGARTQLETTKQEIPPDHPQFDYLRSAPGFKWTHTGIDQDYSIPEFRMLIASPSIVKSRLIWQAMCSAPDSSLKSRFRWNQSYSTYEGDSSLVHELREARWVPQKNGESISFVRPKDASITLLPEGFPYQTEQKWLEAIEFGKIAKQQRSEDILKEAEQNLRNRRAAEMGFNSVDEANTMAEIANAWKAQGKSPDELRDKLIAGKRRKERILIELEDAPEKEYEQRLRSVRSTIGTIDRRTYLRAQYTTDDDKMECQMCRQDMPFKKRNSDEDYFEAVEALKKDHFPKEHEAQHLALCPACAAKYKEFVKRDEKARAALYSLLKNSGIPEGRLQLSDLVIRIWFKEKHWQDLKTVLDYYENIYNPDESD